MLVCDIIVAIFYSSNPATQTRCDSRSIFKQSLTGLDSEFSFSKTGCLTKAEEPSLSYYLSIARGRIIGFIPFPRVLVLCEMQSVRSRIWTRIIVSISYDDNYYTMGTTNLVACSNSSHAIMLTFGLILLEKAWNPISPPSIGLIVPLLFFSKDGLGNK